MKRYYYSNTIPQYLAEDQISIFGKLANAHSRDLNDLTKNSWNAQIKILKDQLQGFDKGQIYFEFSIPRMGKRVDNVLVIDDKIFLLEFKVGDSVYQKYAIDQVIDYSLDLRNFHEGSHYEKLVPVLVAINAPEIQNEIELSENLFKPLKRIKKTLLQKFKKFLKLLRKIALILSLGKTPSTSRHQPSLRLHRGYIKAIM